MAAQPFIGSFEFPVGANVVWKHGGAVDPAAVTPTLKADVLLVYHQILALKGKRKIPLNISCPLMSLPESRGYSPECGLGRGGRQGRGKRAAGDVGRYDVCQGLNGC